MRWWDYILRATEDFPVRVNVITEPIREPILSSEALAHLRVLSTDEVDTIDALIETSRDYVEGYTGRRLVKQQVSQTLDRFPRARALDLYGSPLLSTGLLSTGEVRIVVKYWPDGASTHEVFGSSHYIVSDNREGNLPRLTLKRNKQWPTRELRTADAVEIEYWVGFGTGIAAAPIPGWARQASLLLIGHWFENREAVVLGSIATTVPLAAKAILDRHRVAGAMI